MNEIGTHMARPEIRSFFDPVTSTATHIVHAGYGSACAIIDPVLDYDPKSGRIGDASADAVAAFVLEYGLTTEWILETHAHADHVSAAAILQSRLGGRIGIGERITEVQRVFKDLFHLGEAQTVDGSAFDHLFQQGEIFKVGALECKVHSVPGHTPACVAYQFSDVVFVGDTLFMPDVGTARCDFPGGDANALYQSIHRLLSLPAETTLYMCHDYPKNGRPVRLSCTISEQRAKNIHVADGITQAEFVAARSARDKTLEVPALLLPSVQININAGTLPHPESNGISYLKIPLNAL